MKKAVIAGIAIGAIIGLGAAIAHAAEALPKDATIDASELSGSPYVAVINHKTVGIDGITCPGWYTNAQNIPGGVIDPSEVVLIKFSSSKCDKGIEVHFTDGHKTTIQGFDTSKNTFLHVK